MTRYCLQHMRVQAEMRSRWVAGGCAVPCLALLILGGFLAVLLLALQQRPLAPQPPGLGADDRPPELSVLIGVLTVPDKYELRHFLRLVYAAQGPPLPAEVDVKFVFCNLTTAEQKAMVALEILRFDDIVVLDCAENMDGGKTYAYFSSLPAILPRRYDYVMKADDDTFVGLGALARSLRLLPREDLYYGYVTPCYSGDPFSGYMSGMGYLLSWDLVEWIASSEIPRGAAVGTEDKLVGRWLDDGKKARNRFTAKPAMYDYSAKGYGGCSHPLVPETVAVHRLKTRERWVEVLSFFNLTKPLKPSKLYHIDW